MSDLSPLQRLHRQAGAVFGQWQGQSVPLRFGDVADEYRAVRERAGIIDWVTCGAIEVRGVDRVAFLHNLLTQDIKRLAPGRAALVTPTAKVLADLLVVAESDAHWLLTDRSRVETVRATLDRYVISEVVELIDRSNELTTLAIQGPASSRVLHAAFPRTCQPEGPLTHLRVEDNGASLLVVEATITGQAGYVLLVPIDRAAELWQRLLTAGRDFGAMPVGWDALNALRIESGIAWYGADIDESNLLPETGLERDAISEAKGCYVGQEIIARMLTYGSANRKLMGLLIDGEIVPVIASPIMKDSETIGTVTSACWSFALRRPIAMGYVKRPLYEPGNRVDIVAGDARLASTIVARPIVPAMEAGRTLERA